MKTATVSLAILTLFCFLALPGKAQAQTAQPGHQRPSEGEIVSVLKELRLEMLQEGIDFQNWKIKHIERELRLAQDQRRRIEEQQRAIYFRLAEISQRPSGGEETAGDLEAIKADVSDGELKGAQDRLQAIGERVSELTEQLRQEQERLRELQKKLRILQSQ